MIKGFSSGVLSILLFLLFSGCKGVSLVGLADIRFIFLAVLFLAVAISIASSYKNGKDK